jgi:hypothetical protein
MNPISWHSHYVVDILQCHRQIALSDELHAAAFHFGLWDQMLKSGPFCPLVEKTISILFLSLLRWWVELLWQFASAVAALQLVSKFVMPNHCCHVMFAVLGSDVCLIERN